MLSASAAAALSVRTFYCSPILPHTYEWLNIPGNVGHNLSVNWVFDR